MIRYPKRIVKRIKKRSLQDQVKRNAFGWHYRIYNYSSKPFVEVFSNESDQPQYASYIDSASKNIQFAGKNLLTHSI